jgi:hypothetical protein
MSAVSHPTFVFGVGRLGQEVLTRLSADLPSVGGAARANAVLAQLDLSDEPADKLPDEIMARVDGAGGARSHPDKGEAEPVTVLRLKAPLDKEAEARLRDFTLERALELLRLGHFLDYTEAGDLFRPNFSVFVVGDLGEEPVRKTVSDVVRTVGENLLTRYSHIFTPLDVGGPNFGVYPVLVLGGVHEPDPDLRKQVTASVYQMARLAGDSSNWWNLLSEESRSARPCISRITLLDDQTEKYVLNRSEIISSVLSFLTMSLFSGDLRHAQRDVSVLPLANFLQGDPEKDDATGQVAKGRFATFGAATLDAAQKTAGGYVHNRVALAVLDAMRPDAPARPLGEGLRHLWSVKEMTGLLKSPTWSEQFEQESGTIADRIHERLSGLSDDLKGRCPAVFLSDSPEEIVNHKYSWPWYEDLAGRFTHTCQELEERELPRAAEEIDRYGLALARKNGAELGEQVDKWVWSEPPGWHRARQHLQELGETVRREQSEFELEPDLPELPDTEPVRNAVLEVRRAARLWPRRWRMRITSAVAVLLLAALFHFLPKWVYVRFSYENTVYIKRPDPKTWKDKAGRLAGKAKDWAARRLGFKDEKRDPRVPEGYMKDPRYDPPGWLGNTMLFKLPPRDFVASILVDRPLVFVWLILLFGFLVGWVVRRHARKRQEEMDRAIWLLKNRIEELTVGASGSVRQYFEKRLKFSRDLWIRRLLDRTLDQAGEDIERLNVVDRALTQLRHRYREDQKRLGVRFGGPDEDIEDLSGLKSDKGDPIYRRMVDPETLQQLLRTVAPDPDKHAMDFFERQRLKQTKGEKETGRLPEWRDSAPFADGRILDGFLVEVMETHSAELNLLDQALRGGADKERTAELARELNQFFSDLTGKLSHSVELSVPTGSVALTRLLVCPARHLDALKENFDRLTDETSLQDAHRAAIKFVGTEDTERLHLFVGYAGLPASAFRWLGLTPPGSGSGPQGGKPE